MLSDPIQITHLESTCAERVAPVATDRMGVRAASPKLDGESSSDRYKCFSVCGEASARAVSDSIPTCSHKYFVSHVRVEQRLRTALTYSYRIE